MTINFPTVMKAAVTRNWNDIQIEQVPVPELESGEVLVRVGACGICGTDLKILAGVYAGLWPPSLPFIQGHEWSGTVVALGKDVTGLEVGDRVAAENHKGCGICANCREGRYNLCEATGSASLAHKIYGHTAQGAFAEYAARPSSLLHKIPENITFEEATIINQGALGLHAIHRCNILPGETVAITGPGLIGLVTLQLAKAFGAGRIIISGSGPRLKMAGELGADELVDITKSNPLDRIMEITNGRGVDCAFECAGTTDSVNTALNSVKRGGRIALIGLTGNKTIELNPDHLTLDEIDVFGVRSSPNSYPELIKLISTGDVKVSKLVSRVYPLENINEAIEVYRKREAGAIRMVIRM